MKRLLVPGAAFLAGVLLRCYRLPDQILGDDEFHAIHAALVGSYSFIFKHFGEADHSIPVTLFYKLWMEFGALKEGVVRFPMLVAGILLLLVVPLLSREFLKTESQRNTFRWLLALSPLCIYFSRYARPYAMTLLLTSAGVICFYRWMRGGTASNVVLYGACAVIAPWVHQAAGPILMAAPLYGFLRKPPGYASPPRPRLWYVYCALAVVAAEAFLIGPPLLLSRGLILKLGRGAPDLWTLTGSVELLSGVGVLWLGIALFGLILLEVAKQLHEQREWVLYLLFVSGMQILVTLVTRPVWLHVPIVFTRYMISLLPFLLLFLAGAIGRLEKRLQASLPSWPTGVVPLSLLVVLFWNGPIPRTYWKPNNWTNHAIYQYSYDPDHPYALDRLLKPAHVPLFYSHLAETPPGTLTLLEAPWFYQWGINNLPFYQQVHRQRTKIGFIGNAGSPQRRSELPVERPELQFAHFIHVGDRDALLSAGVDYVVFHKDLKREIEQVPVIEVLEAPDPSPWIPTYEEWFGEPVFEDDTIIVFRVLKEQSVPTNAARRVGDDPG